MVCQGILGKPSKWKFGQTWDIVPTSLGLTPPPKSLDMYKKNQKYFNAFLHDSEYLFFFFKAGTHMRIDNHLPTLLGQCPKLDRIFLLTSSLNWFIVRCHMVDFNPALTTDVIGNVLLMLCQKQWSFIPAFLSLVLFILLINDLFLIDSYLFYSDWLYK